MMVVMGVMVIAMEFKCWWWYVMLMVVPMVVIVMLRFVVV